jgi:HemY protein
MRKLFVALILLLASVAAALWLREHDGFVIVQVGRWSVQVSLIIFLAALLILWLVIEGVLALFRRARRTPRQLRHWLGERRHQRAQHDLLSGLSQVAEGRYLDAERTLLSHVRSADVPVLHHLIAAVAAQRRGAWETRDEHLAAADRSTPGADVAVGLLQAQLQVEAEQWEQALATLNWLRDRAPRNRRAVGLLAQCLLALGDYDRLWEMLPDLRRRGTLPQPRLLELERRVVSERFTAAAVAGGAELKALWRYLDREQRREPELRALYAEALIDAGREGEAERELLGWLRHRWDDRLVAVWGRLGSVNGERVFAQTERWLKERPQDVRLLEAAGRQAMTAELWGRARSYLEAAAARSSRAELQLLLAELYERIGEPERARQAYRRVLGLEAGRSALPPVEAPAIAASA